MSHPLAACLDGSHPGYYFRKGRNANKNSWIIFFQARGGRTGAQEEEGRELRRRRVAPECRIKGDDTLPSNSPILYFLRKWHQNLFLARRVNPC